MTRNLKALGLALVAAFALSAMAASAASAQEFHFTSEVEHTDLTGEQIGVDTFVVDGGTTTCNVAEYEGTVEGETSTEITLEPTYDDCDLHPFGSAVVDMNSCDYEFTPVAKEENDYEVEAAIDCATPGDSITVVAKLFLTKCTVHIGEQTNLGTITVEEDGNGNILADVNISGIDYNQTAGEGIGACSNALNTTNGTYEGTALIEGFDSLGEPVNIGLGDT